MSMTSTVKLGQTLAQSGKPLPNLSTLPYSVRQDLTTGYNSGKK